MWVGGCSVPVHRTFKCVWIWALCRKRSVHNSSSVHYGYSEESMISNVVNILPHSSFHTSNMSASYDAHRYKSVLGDGPRTCRYDVDGCTNTLKGLLTMHYDRVCRRQNSIDQLASYWSNRVRNISCYRVSNLPISLLRTGPGTEPVQHFWVGNTRIRLDIQAGHNLLHSDLDPEWLVSTTQLIKK